MIISLLTETATVETWTLWRCLSKSLLRKLVKLHSLFLAYPHSQNHTLALFSPLRRLVRSASIVWLHSMKVNYSDRTSSSMTERDGRSYNNFEPHTIIQDCVYYNNYYYVLTCRNAHALWCNAAPPTLINFNSFDPVTEVHWQTDQPCWE